MGVLYLLHSAYLAAFATPSIAYMLGVFAHFAGGLALCAVLVALLVRRRSMLRPIRTTVGLTLGAGALGVFLAVAGNVRAHRWALLAHIACAGLALLALAPWLGTQAREAGGRWRTLRRSYLCALAALVAAPLTTTLHGRWRPDPRHVIRNPEITPVTMQEEGGGPRSPFWPSSARTNVGGIIPSNFFMDSANCGRCHRDIYEQWNSSVHHFASFNNQFYRKSIEYMQDVVGTQPSKWCAGCHDHAVFFNGRFERPIKEQIDTPEAHAGLACTSCHSIAQVHSSMGQGDITMEYPALHQVANSQNPLIRAMDNFLTYLDPEPHRKTFMRPFMRQDSAEFCSACHKVHLDVPVNKYRWFRGFNDYDSWQASGVSGQGARSFYYPKQSKTCVDCHMPLVESRDPGNRNRKVHSHRFAAANMAVAFVNRDESQMKAVRDFLQSGFVTVDIFAVAPAGSAGGDAPMRRRSDEGPELMSSFAVGEEGEMSSGGVIRQVGDVTAPIDRAGFAVTAGSTVRVDVVVRTRAIGHFFPGGTVDAFDVWLELKGVDGTGRTVFWSGGLRGEDGPVEKGAHFYRALLLDGEGNPVNKRNAWQARSVFYVRLIPPGAADVAHYRMRIPPDAVGPITLSARLNYRKFSHYYTQFAYAGRPRPGQSPALLGASFNSLEYSFEDGNVPANVSGQMKGGIPRLPVVVVAAAEAQLNVGARPVAWSQVVEKQGWERWNDWGIGLLQQGDLKGAEYAFNKATEADPEHPDGWLNVARALVREGETEAAKRFVQRALDLSPDLPRAWFFRALIQKTDGDYEGALASLARVEKAFPRDRVVLNQAARLWFLRRDYQRALGYLARVRRIDPEDLAMHYTAMLCYRGLRDFEKAAVEEALFRRLKADESSQAITGRWRRQSPEDNNERQQIHDHESVPLDGARGVDGRTAAE